MLWLRLIVLCFGLYFNSFTLLVAGVNRNEDSSRHSTSAPGGRILSRFYTRKSHNYHHQHPHHHHQQHHQHTTSSRQHQGDSADDGKESTKLLMQLKENSGKSMVALEDDDTQRRHDEFYGDRAQQAETSIDRKISVYTPEEHSSKDNKHNNNNINKHHHHHHKNKNNHNHNSKNNNTNNNNNNNNHNKTITNNINNNNNNNNSDIKHKDNGTSLPNKCPKCRQRDNEMQLRLALIKDNILKYLGLSSVPDIKDPSIPQIPTVQHAISGHTMQKDTPFHSGRKQDLDKEYGGHTLRPLQRIMVSYPLSNSTFSNLSNTFQFSLKLLPYMYSIKKAILWLYLRPVQTEEEEGFTVLEVNCLSSNKSLRTRKVKLERNSEGKGKWNTFETTKLIKKRLIAKDENIQMQATAIKYGVNHLVLLSDYQENRGYKPYLEIQMIPNRRKRRKRGVGLQCDATKLENRCCLYPMEVTFADFGWNWIIIPLTYRANYCSGECDIKLLQDYAHTSMVSNLKQNSSQIICCTPTALSPLSLLYFNDDAVIEQRDLPNMIVDSCGCR